MDYKTPKLTTDGAIIKDGKILLIRRKNEPFKGKWALPGGFVEYGEKVEYAVIREVKEETGLITKIKEIFGIYSDPNRDPRGHTVTIVFLLNIITGKLNAQDDADSVKFFNLNKLPDLSFDHRIIIEDIKRRMKNNVLPKM
jgi:8-oxo-dGTP diphosphatase